MSTAASHHREPSQTRSVRRPPPPVAIVVTTPTWAKDEPQSDEDLEITEDRCFQELEQGTSQFAQSCISSSPEIPSPWWVFNNPRNPVLGPPSSPKPERRSFSDFSSWMSSRRNSFSLRAIKENFPQSTDPDTTSRTADPVLSGPPESHNDDLHGQPHELRGNGLRSFVLTNVYVPLLFRFINISFTTSALVLSIRIRNLEIQNSILGAVGSSPTVVTIFGPPTLVHVLFAIYLEYFGRPLGLWRTSAKLAHTLVEVFYICLWSAAFSIAFDNYFTSLIPCTSPSAISWYTQLPRPMSTIPISEKVLGDKICNHQLSLICLVGLGLVAYCSNLIISLYRIFEKVKYLAVPSDYQPSV